MSENQEAKAIREEIPEMNDEWHDERQRDFINNTPANPGKFGGLETIAQDGFVGTKFSETVLDGLLGFMHYVAPIAAEEKVDDLMGEVMERVTRAIENMAQSYTRRLDNSVQRWRETEGDLKENFFPGDREDAQKAIEGLAQLCDSLSGAMTDFRETWQNRTDLIAPQWGSAKSGTGKVRMIDGTAFLALSISHKTDPKPVIFFNGDSKVSNRQKLISALTPAFEKAGKMGAILITTEVPGANSEATKLAQSKGMGVTSLKRSWSSQTDRRAPFRLIETMSHIATTGGVRPLAAYAAGESGITKNFAKAMEDIGVTTKRIAA